MVLRIIFIIGLILQTGICSAKNIADIEIAETATLSDKSEVKLNGAGIRTKFFFDIYIGALYLVAPTKNLQSILSSEGANRVMMHFLYDDLAKNKITDAWIEGFQENNSADEFNKLKQRLDQFNKLFSDSKKGDVIMLDYVPSKGTEVWFNKILKGTVIGADFNKALLKVWLGDEPADGDLKEAMINGG